MGTFLEGLSEIGGGALKGYKFAEDMKDKISDRRKKEKDEQDTQKIINDPEIQKIKKYFKNSQVQAPAQVQAPEQVISPVQEPNLMPTMNYVTGLASADQQQPYQKYKDGGLVRREIGKYADGGLVSMAADPQGLSVKANMAAGINGDGAINGSQEQGGKIDWGRTTSLRMNAARDKAIELGNLDLANNFQELGFKARDDMFKKGLPMAQQVFAKTGDISGYIGLYNDTHDDGYNVVGHNRNDDGTYSLKMQQPDGTTADMNMTTDDMQQMVYQLSNPAARKAEEMAAFREKAANIVKYNNERSANISKANIDIAKENAKPQNVAPGNKLMGNANGGYIGQDANGNMTMPSGLSVLADNQKPKKNFEDIKTVNGGYLQEGENGNPIFTRTEENKKSEFEEFQSKPKLYSDFKRAGKDGDNSGSNNTSNSVSNKERMDAYKYLKESALDSFGTQDALTGKMGINQNVIDITRKGERLLDANQEIPPQTILEIAKNGTNSWQKRKMSNGDIIEVPVIKYKDQYYPLSNGGNRPAKK